jgi:hypothetical protein
MNVDKDVNLDLDTDKDMDMDNLKGNPTKEFIAL